MDPAGVGQLTESIKVKGRAIKTVCHVKDVIVKLHH